MEDDARLGKLLKLLQGSIRAAGLTQTEVDERIGRRRGYLSHVFQRRVDLKVIDLLRALEVLEIDPARFFAVALGSRPEPRASLDEPLLLMGSSRLNGPLQRLDERGARSAEADGLVELVQATVRRVLAEVEDSQATPLRRGRAAFGS